ncbi:unnamed protein product [Mytilus coruscus]|uniref:Uncharacterized protein n=1 Tax=Mytilus coruscus TaxID=42192 RepID=A0A6J8DPE2_MYTCO|nr:unnamed protein product [Mytilus coruscus]
MDSGRTDDLDQDNSVAQNYEDINNEFESFAGYKITKQSQKDKRWSLLEAEVKYATGTSQKIEINLGNDIPQLKTMTYKPKLYLMFVTEAPTSDLLIDEIRQFSKKKKLPCHIIEQKLVFLEDKTSSVCINGHTSDESIQKNNSNVYVLTDEYNEHIIDLNTPWNARKQHSVHEVNDHEEISSISEIQGKMDLDLLICNLLIGVLMTEEDAIYGDDTEIFWNALSMYLLKIGKWQIPKEIVTRSFDHRSIEYIYEKELTTEFENGIWKDLQKLSGKAYIPPKATTIKKPSRKDNGGIPELNGESVALHTLLETSYEEKETFLAVSNPELYGLIFYALLQKQYFAGAKQLVETGYILIQPILIGSTILQDAERNWKSTPVQKETLQRLNNAFTQRAITITQCIYDAESELEELKTNGTNNLYNEDVELELGYPVNHSGRLLLNHGYLEDAIKTENKTYLDNETVIKVLNKMWYGEETLSFRQISYSALLMAFAYMLVFNLNETLSYTDYFIIGWMISLFLDETKQFKDTFGFMVIMTVIMISYNVSFHSLLYPNTDFSWSEIEKVMQNGYWTLFGENNVDSDAFFCYNTNYDQRLSSTELTEAFATLKSKGVIDVIKEDTITVLQEQMEIQNIMMANKDELKMQLEYQTQRFEEQQERNMRRNEMMVEQHLAEQRSMERVESMRREKVELRSISERESIKEYEQMIRRSRDFENLMRELMEEQIRRLYEMNERLDELYAFVKHTEYEQQAHSAQILEIMVQMQQKKHGTDKTQQTMVCNYTDYS